MLRISENGRNRKNAPAWSSLIELEENGQILICYAWSGPDEGNERAGNAGVAVTAPRRIRHVKGQLGAASSRDK